MGSKRRKWPALLTLAGATISMLIAVFLIPPAINDRDFADASLTLFGVGLALLILTAILALGLQTSPDRAIPASVTYPFWRIVTSIVWIVVGLHILFLAAFAFLALFAGALDDRDEAMDILIPQGTTALILAVALPLCAPWRVSERTGPLRRGLILVPVAIVVLFWFWMVRR